MDTVWVEDRKWRVLDPGSPKRCRQRHCLGVPVAEFNRRRWLHAQKVDSWWAYCVDHLYGRRIEEDKVMVKVGVGSPAAERGWIE